MIWPRIVAEALRTLDVRAAAAAPSLRPVEWPAWRHVVSTSDQPLRATGTPPRFLLPTQHDSWRRAQYALAAWGGAVLAEPVGTGKTWIALAVAVAERRPATVLIPAILRAQWEQAATAAGVAIHCVTHEAASRGKLPPSPGGLVIIDEAHRFRHSTTRRVQHVAPWLPGRRVLLLTGTPIVNRVDDLFALLRLFAAEDALRLDGIRSLADCIVTASVSPSMRRLVIRSRGAATIATTRTDDELLAGPGEVNRAQRITERVAGLVLSHDPAVRRLVLSVLLDAGASSNAAWHAALRRYRALLLQSRDAGGATRAMLRKFAGEALDQLVFWPLLEPTTPANATEIPEVDLATVDTILTTPADDDEWIASVARVLDDGVITICFTRHHATAQLLRTALGEQTAWVTGSAAGIGPHRLPRDAVLAAFGPERAHWQLFRRTPSVLVTTDVAAEGLDLQSAGRIVHIDLPWTAMRVDQREGRLLRLGQEHARVELLVRQAAPAFVTALGALARVRRKRSLGDRWLAALEVGKRPDAIDSAPVVFAATDDEGPATLIVLRLSDEWREGVVRVSRVSGEWTIDAEVGDALLARAAVATAFELHGTSASLVARDAARVVVGLTAPVAWGDKELTLRIHRLARVAAIARDGNALARLDRLLRFVTAPATTGSAVLVNRLRLMNDSTFARTPVPDVRTSMRPVATPIAMLLLNP